MGPDLYVAPIPGRLLGGLVLLAGPADVPGEHRSSGTAAGLRGRHRLRARRTPDPAEPKILRSGYRTARGSAEHGAEDAEGDREVERADSQDDERLPQWASRHGPLRLAHWDGGALMPKLDLIGQSYEAFSPAVSVQQSLNCFIETIQTKEGK